MIKCLRHINSSQLSVPEVNNFPQWGMKLVTGCVVMDCRDPSAYCQHEPVPQSERHTLNS